MKLLRSVMIMILGISILALAFPLLTGSNPLANATSEGSGQTSALLPTGQGRQIQPSSTPAGLNQPAGSQPTEMTTPEQTPEPTPTPDPFPLLYDCEMELMFLDGPLAQESAQFTVLGRDYFTDKGDKFAPGKGTAIFYEDQRYFILHSSYVDGNILKPMEAEFIRRYLENWGNTGPETIQENITTLVGTEAVWICNGKSVFKTQINGVVRLSHTASQQLWLEPQAINQILQDREGLVSEWVGEIPSSDEPTLFIGFCGWGPSSMESGRYTYFRYLLQFEIDVISTP